MAPHPPAHVPIAPYQPFGLLGRGTRALHSQSDLSFPTLFAHVVTLLCPAAHSFRAGRSTWVGVAGPLLTLSTLSHTSCPLVHTLTLVTPVFSQPLQYLGGGGGSLADLTSDGLPGGGGAGGGGLSEADRQVWLVARARLLSRRQVG